MLSKDWKKPILFSGNVAFVSFVLIGAVAAYNWLVAPHRNYLLAAQKYESAASNLAGKNQIIRDGLAVERRKLDELQEDFERTRVGLFDPVGAENFFNGIQTEAKETGCVVNALKFMSNKPKSGANRTRKKKGGNGDITARSVMLNVSGSYRNIVALMNMLQNRLQKVQIDSVQIGPLGEKSGRLKCTAIVTIYITPGKEEVYYD